MKKLTFLVVVAIFSWLSVAAQTSAISNNTLSSGDYLGWNASTGFDLHIKHLANRRIVFSTNNNPHAGISGNGYFLSGTPTPIDNGLVSILYPGSANNKYGVFSTTSGFNSRAGFFVADNAFDNAGMVGIAVTPNTVINIGVYGRACTSNGTAAGVFGTLGICESNTWAGYFDGPTFCTDGVWTASDLNFKTSVEPLAEGMGLLSSLIPKQYNFINPEGIEITLPQGLQYGLIAQELQLAIPHAVTNVTHGQKLEAMRAGEVQDFSFLGVNYSQLIPVLIKAFQERQAEIDAHQEELLLIQLLIEEAELSLALLQAE